MQPPRALWVPFPLGRPLGKPGDAAFQLDVINAALDLLNRSRGPVLEDYPHDVPPLAPADATACPVSFPQNSGNDGSWAARLQQEFAELEPWYSLALRRRSGRTLVAVAEQSPQQNLEDLARLLDEGTLPADIVWLKRAVEDLKAFYIEAMTAQPGEYDSQAVEDQLWQQTCFGGAVLTLARQYQQANSRQLRIVARLLAPRRAFGARTGPSNQQEPSND